MKDVRPIFFCVLRKLASKLMLMFHGYINFNNLTNFGNIFFNRPVLMAPKFDSSDACNADYNATLVLCTMLSSQLSEGPPTSRVDSEAEQPRAGKGQLGDFLFLDS